MRRWRQIFLAEILLIIILITIEKSLIISFISIMLHELAHVLVAKSKGSDFNNFQLHIYGSKVELMDLDELSDKDKLLIYIAGPLSNIILAIIFLGIGFYTSSVVIKSVVSINIGLAVFNLLPSYPLDGARCLEIILSKKILYKRAKEIISILSYVIASFFILGSIVVVIVLKVWNPTMILAAAIIIYITTTEKKAVMYILMGNLFRKRRKLIKNKYLENKTISVYYKQGLANVMTIIDKNKFNIFYVLNDDLKLLYILNEDELVEALKSYGNITLEEYKDKRSL